MRYCTKCGAEVEEGKRFCTRCGAPVKMAPAADEKGTGTGTKLAAAPDPGKNNKTGVIIAAAAAVFALVVGGGILFMKRSAETGNRNAVKTQAETAAAVETAAPAAETEAPKPTAAETPPVAAENIAEAAVPETVGPETIVPETAALGTTAAEPQAAETLAPAAQPPAASAYKTMYVVNCRESITLRTSPSTQAAELRQIPLGAPVSFVENAANGFYKVIYNGNEGYALAAYLNEDPYSSYTAAGNPASNNGGYYSAAGIPYGGSMYVVNCRESISLRETPSTSARALLQIPLHARVEYLGDASNGFCQISYGGFRGYALKDYLDEMEPQISIGQYMRVVNCRESITLRSDPSTSGKEICQIPLGATVYAVSAASNGFYMVQYNGYTGYALSGYLQY